MKETPKRKKRGEYIYMWSQKEFQEHKDLIPRTWEGDSLGIDERAKAKDTQSNAWKGEWQSSQESL